MCQTGCKVIIGRRTGFWKFGNNNYGFELVELALGPFAKHANCLESWLVANALILKYRKVWGTLVP